MTSYTVEHITVALRDNAGRRVRVGCSPDTFVLTIPQTAAVEAAAAAATGDGATLPNANADTVLRLACQMVEGYQEVTSEALAAEVQAPYRLAVDAVGDVFDTLAALAVANGVPEATATDDLAHLYLLEQLRRDLDRAVEDGSLKTIYRLMRMAPRLTAVKHGHALDSGTIAAFDSLPAAIANSRLDLAAERLATAPPATVDAASVDAALLR